MFYGILVMIILVCLGGYINTKVKNETKYLLWFIIGATVGLVSHILAIYC
jgi:hypothetical protein